MKFIFASVIIIVFALLSCDDNNEDYSNLRVDSYEHIDSLKRVYKLGKDYSIILNDMDYDDSTKQCRHKYELIKFSSNPDTVIKNVTGWVIVDDVFFENNADYLGMEILSSSNDIQSKKATPPGYNRIYGNSHYGHWDPSTGAWIFFARYMYLRSMMNYAMYPPVYMNDWNNYNNNYRNRQAYYGRNNSGRNIYGTKSAVANKRFSDKTWMGKPSQRRAGIRKAVGSRATQLKSAKASSFGGSRSTGRSRSSFRSRGGGFGK